MASGTLQVEGSKGRERRTKKVWGILQENTNLVVVVVVGGWGGWGALGALWRQACCRQMQAKPESTETSFMKSKQDGLAEKLCYFFPF